MNATKTLSPGSLDRLVRRISDGTLHEPSFPDEYSDFQALDDMLSGGSQWYFRRIVQLPRRWWQLRPRWKRTGEIWKPKNSIEFDVIELND